MKAFFILISILFYSQAYAELTVGEPAPSFELRAEDGKFYGLEKFKGKVIVLEWLNHGCPFVRKHYDSGNMQKLQKTYTEKDIVWLSIVSSAEGKQGYVDASGAFKEKQEYSSKATRTLLDPDGKVGQAYGAKTTPHMYIIDEAGILLYQGAIDSISTADKDDIEKADNYVSLALEQKLANKPIKITSTKAYGCSVKY
tara:strand:- start:29469 stop:30062 length:594 start_codon:yes stop_codon:yes gene_type:complete